MDGHAALLFLYSVNFHALLKKWRKGALRSAFSSFYIGKKETALISVPFSLDF